MAIHWIIDYISLYYISFILFFFSFISDCIQISQICIQRRYGNGASTSGVLYPYVVGREDWRLGLVYAHGVG